MKITFHAPLKSPDHPVPSGDRLMGGLLIAALKAAGHEVEIASKLRTFMREPSSEALPSLQRQALAERGRITEVWQDNGVPDAWLTYHPYYKAPDLIGPALSQSLDIPYVTVETSYSARRNLGAWAEAQAIVLQSLKMARVNICLTRRDQQGLVEAAPTARTAILPPFLDSAVFLALPPRPRPGRLVTMAMMRPGNKMDSLAMLAEALRLIEDQVWTLSIIGDGSCRAQAEALFAGFEPERIIWHGQQGRQEIAALLSESAVHVWPGCTEAYGLSYLETQAAGLPVVAQDTHGVPEVVIADRTGLLTPVGDVRAYADAIRAMLANPEMRARMGAEARRFVSEERSLDQAARRLDAILRQHVGKR
jgi:glycosyltransferase involved in cell wall biosynthesis